MKRKVLLIFPLLLSGFVLVQAANGFLSQAYAYSSYQVMQKNLYGAMSKKFYRDTMASLDKAISLQPDNAALYMTKGDMLIYSSDSLKDNVLESRQQAVQAYHEAKFLSAASPYPWAKYAIAKGVSGEFDESFYKASQQAVEYGRREYWVNRYIVQTGFRHWYSTEISHRFLLKDAVRRLYEVDPYNTILLAKEYGQFRMTCLWVDDYELQIGKCNAELKYNR